MRHTSADLLRHCERHPCYRTIPDELALITQLDILAEAVKGLTKAQERDTSTAADLAEVVRAALAARQQG